MLAFEPAAFIVADSVGGKLALVNQEQGVSDCAEINGHHIGGLARSTDGANLLIAHQQLSPNARTDEDDLRWGLLIKNSLINVQLPWSKNQRQRPKVIETIQLGKFGYGAADPSALVTLRERVVVALSGINQVALIPRERSRISFVTVGRVPERLVRLGDQFLCCAPL